MAQPPFTHPSAMPGHAVVAHGGQAMVHGHPSNQGVPGGGQPGVTMGQQFAPGMAVPGGPPVSQAGPMMGGMIPPGAGGPTAQAMAHLNPVPNNPYQQQMSKSTFFYLCNTLHPFDPTSQWQNQILSSVSKLQYVHPWFNFSLLRRRVWTFPGANMTPSFTETPRGIKGREVAVHTVVYALNHLYFVVIIVFASSFLTSTNIYLK